MGYSPWGRKELDMTEWLMLSLVSNFKKKLKLIVTYLCSL